MLLLTAATDFLELQTQAAVSTDWTASWVDLDYAAGTFVPGSAAGNLVVIATLSIVPAPAWGVQRQLKYISVVNRDSATAQNIILDKNSVGVAYNLIGAFLLMPGDSLQYVDSKGFSVIDSQGREKFVGDTGVQGPPGATGAPGSSSTTTYTYTQSAPASTWTITHNLGRFPSVSVVDSANSEVDGDLQYVDANNLILNFSAPFSGEAYLN